MTHKTSVRAVIVIEELSDTHNRISENPKWISYNFLVAMLLCLTINSRIASKNNVQVEVTYFVPYTDINNEAYTLKGH